MIAMFGNAVEVLLVPDKFKARLYESKNLKSWKLLSEYGPLGDAAKIWGSKRVKFTRTPGKLVSSITIRNAASEKNKYTNPSSVNFDLTTGRPR